MEDKEIVELFWSRSEDAIQEVAKKYEKYCYYIAYGILRSHEDAKECVNDTYYQVWNTIPPQRPSRLSTFMGKITRNLALNRWEYHNAEKRGRGEIPLVLEELQECIPNGNPVEEIVDRIHLEEVFNDFLAGLSKKKRMIFLRRYWYLSSIKEIATDFGMSESKVKMMLLRLRKDFRDFLEKEGVQV